MVWQITQSPRRAEPGEGEKLDDWYLDETCLATCEWPTYHPPMYILTVELPGKLHATLTNEARRRNVTRSCLAREIIENALVPGTPDATRSCADLAGDLVGAVRSGHTDLATNRRLLDEAVGRDARRAVADDHD